MRGEDAEGIPDSRIEGGDDGEKAAEVGVVDVGRADWEHDFEYRSRIGKRTIDILLKEHPWGGNGPVKVGHGTAIWFSQNPDGGVYGSIECFLTDGLLMGKRSGLIFCIGHGDGYKQLSNVSLERATSMSSTEETARYPFTGEMDVK